ncbi:hypothetical protein CC78DRAFT_242988 [Lojkania enalia]|uniref:Uncharacterized protein n=1 Tax=Lojkania enalia TaxID=147567 RepID=A0A9P4NAX0_9PLEO|nr:hypothetical protein CC78DRAFT_242988 [Didymosphaeria enalia]
MLVALHRGSASLRVPPATASSLPQSRAPLLPKTSPRLPTRPHSTSIMFKQAVKSHKVITPSQNHSVQQQSLSNSFKRASAAYSHGTRPLSTGSGNVIKHNATAEHRKPGQTHGIKRTSSGLAKALGSQEDAFDYPALNISDSDEFSSSVYTTGVNHIAPQAPVFFDADDFDSDLDLDVEDPATKRSVNYPTLPSLATMTPTTPSTYNPPRSATKSRAEPTSSQYTSWSSSPVDHYKTPPKPAPSKRRTLPWLQNPSQNQNQVKLESSALSEEDADEEQESQLQRPRKRTSTEETQSGSFTPLPKSTPKTEYPWNTTASAVKQQQKSLREVNKRLTKKHPSSHIPK